MNIKSFLSGMVGEDPYWQTIPSPCQPKTCAEVNAQCGQADDGCGTIMNCGSCQPPYVCDGGQCVWPEGKCKPLTCSQAGCECGACPDGCGSTMQCGDCVNGTKCGDGGPNKCGTAKFRRAGIPGVSEASGAGSFGDEPPFKETHTTTYPCRWECRMHAPADKSQYEEIANKFAECNHRNFPSKSFDASKASVVSGLNGPNGSAFSMMVGGLEKCGEAAQGDESSGMSTGAKVGIGVMVLGAVGFGIWKLWPGIFA